MKLAPIVLFAYNRPDHTKKTLDALATNPEARESHLYIYCDGPKSESDNGNQSKMDQVISIAKKENRFRNVNVTIQKKNKGLANSIIDGVTETVNKYGKVIVLEDDLVTSVGFLKYMNDALQRYQDNPKVMHVSGYMYPHKEQLPETFFFKVPLCWGWATWSRAWECFNNDSIKLWCEIGAQGQFSNFDKFGGDYLSSQLAYNISGKLNTWFIKWHASVFLKDGYTLYPKKSLVDNIGFDDSGVHNRFNDEFKNKDLINNINVDDIEVVENENAKMIIKSFYNVLTQKPNKNSFQEFIKIKTKNLIFSVFPKLKTVLENSNKISLNRTYLGQNCKIYLKARMNNVIIGNYTYISENSIINNTIIGKFCSIGPNLISGWGTHPTNGISTHPMFYSIAEQNGMTLSSENKTKEYLPIRIGNDVFIGMNVTILDGIMIGDGAIIGAGAVVSKDIPAYAIAVGNPVKIVKYRFEDEIIENLIKIEWWNFNKEDLVLIEKYFFDISDFIKLHEA
jgi:acetyltransferase-like isoleucine patch superfamily enzyme